MSRLLFVAATDREASPFRDRGFSVVVSGVGRVNAAVATALALERGNHDAAISVGVAGALPGSDLVVGDQVVADRAVYVEEGMLGPDGFHDLASMGFPPASFFDGNGVAGDPGLIRGLRTSLSAARVGSVATVATCSATDAGAMMVAERTGAIAEAMEGAAVIHAAGLLGVPGGEIRVISNQTGDRDRQEWDLDGAMKSLAAVAEALSS